MFLVASALLGYLTNWWWFPASAGLLGQAVHFASSARYRRQIKDGGSLPAVAGATLLLTIGCFLTFALGRWFAL